MTLIVNGERVDEELLRQEFATIKSYHEQRGNVSCCEKDGEFRSHAEENVISRVLLVQEARRTTEPVPEADVDVALRRLQEEAGGRDKFFAAYNLTPEQEPDVRRDLETNLRVQRMIDRVLGPEANPGDTELRAFYERNLDRYMKPERVRASHILKAPGRGDDRAKAWELLRELREKALAGADFAALAREHSDKARREGDAEDGSGDGVDLGFFRRGEIMEEFESVVFSMREGEVSPVFLSPFGFHLARLTGREPATPHPFEEVRDRVLEHVLQERRDGKLRALLAQLRAKATIQTVEDPA
jgi:parvulin-like peptidyl-prolyl isomerase